MDAYLDTSRQLFRSVGLTVETHFQILEAPVRQVHYYETGRGIPLLLLHGGGGNAADWYSLAPYLADRYRLLLVNRPGCGLTDFFDYQHSQVNLFEHAATFVRDFLDSFGIETIAMVANSMGGLFAVSFAAAYPHRVHQLVLIGHPAGGTRTIPFLPRLLALKGVNRVLLYFIRKSGIEGTKDFYQKLLVVDITRLPEIYWENTWNAQTIPGSWESFLSLLEHCVGLNGFQKRYLIHRFLQQLSQPVTFIVGDNDRWDTIENTRNLAAGMANATVEIVEDAGHLPWLDQPAQCGQLVLEALQKVN